jgi:hypothetical protein
MIGKWWRLWWIDIEEADSALSVCILIDQPSLAKSNLAEPSVNRFHLPPENLRSFLGQGIPFNGRYLSSVGAARIKTQGKYNIVRVVEEQSTCRILPTDTERLQLFL